MTHIIRLLSLSVLLLGLSTCQDYLDINTNPNQPETPGDLDLLLADMTATTSYNLVGGGNWTRYAAQWIQHIADNSTPPSDDTYRVNTSDTNNEWAFSSYAGVLINGQQVIERGTDLEQWHHVGIAQVLMAHNYALLTDWWGDIPFSEALGRAANSKPVFDDQETVYQGIQQLLDDGIANLAKDVGVSVGSGDFYFAGDAAAWTKVAYALKARYYLRLTNAPGYDDRQQAQLALDALDNAMQSLEDMPVYNYQDDPGAESPWNQWVTKFANSMQISDYIVTFLQERNDPRLPIMADPNDDGVYLGHRNGAMPTNTLGQRSSIGAYYLRADLDIPLITYWEQLFMEAEALYRLGRTDEAAAAYESAIGAHLQSLDVAADDIRAYVASQPLVDLETIMNQKYIAGFLFGSFEAYNDYRRTGFPASLMPALNSDFNQIPTRMIYTDTEINNNADNVPGGVTLTSRVWWDGD